MQINQLTAPSAWWALIWKDIYQVKPALSAVAILLCAIQLLLFCLYSFLPNFPSGAALEATLVFPLIGPILGGLACCGMLIGQERQSGTWAWSSSLPASWNAALGSKLLVSLGSSFLLVLPLLVVPLLGWLLGQRLPASGSFTAIYASPVSLFILLEVIVFLFLATMIFRETMTGMVVGAIWIAFSQLIIVSLSNSFISRVLNYLGFALSETALICSQMAFLVALGILPMVLIFRWRWGIGQSAELSLWPRSDITALAPRVATRRGSVPSEFWVLLVQSARMSLIARACTVLAMFSLCVYFMRGPDGSIFVASVVAAVVLGTTVFEGDQSSGRFRFLADRGVSPRRLVTARLIPPALLTCFACGIPIVWFYIAMDEPPALLFVSILLCSAAFVIGGLASLCFNKPIIAGTVAVMTMAGIALSYAAMADGTFNQNDLYPHWLIHDTISLIPISLLFGLASLYWLAPNWLTNDNPKLVRHFSWISAVGAIAPPIFVVLFGFLAVQRVEWQGAPLASFDRRPSEAPPLTISTLDVNGKLHANSSFTFYASDPRYVKERISEAVASLSPERTTHFEFQQIRSQLNQLLTELRAEPQPIQGEALLLLRTLDTLIAETAVLGAVYLEQGHVESARLAWRCNKLLQEIPLGSATMTTLSGRLASFGAFQQLSDEQLLALGSADELRQQYLPVESVDSAIYSQWLRERATVYRESLNGRGFAVTVAHVQHVPLWPWTLRYIPTLRWRQERNIAIAIAKLLGFQSGIMPLSQSSDYAQFFGYESYQYSQLQALTSAVSARLSSLESSQTQ